MGKLALLNRSRANVGRKKPILAGDRKAKFQKSVASSLTNAFSIARRKPQA